MQDGAELRAFVADGIANGIRPWFAKFNAKVIDQRWMEPVAQIYDWCWRNEKYLRNTRSLAAVAMVYSQRTAQRYGGSQAAEKVENHALGFYQALIEARVPFEMAHDELLDHATPAYKLLILPNIAALSDQQCVQIREYVRNGGSIVATHETSLYEETGKRRNDFGLADVFGCSFGGEITHGMQNAYLALNGPHALLRRSRRNSPHYPRREPSSDQGSRGIAWAVTPDSELPRLTDGRSLPEAGIENQTA